MAEEARGPITGSIRMGDADSSDKEERWIARVSHKMADFLKRFRAAVARKPWLNVVYIVTLSTIGGVVILAGIIMLVTPGPGWLTIFLGLAVLGTEFAWARRVLTWLRMKVRQGADAWKRWRVRRARKKAARIVARRKQQSAPRTSAVPEEVLG